MDNKAKSIIVLILTNLINLSIGIIIGFVIPMVLTRADYAEYKVYTFYTGFIPLIHFGVVDGIVLKYARYSKEDLESTPLHGALFIQMIFIVSISIILGLINYMFLNVDYIYVLLIATTTPALMVNFISSLYRINMNFKLFSLNNTLGKFFTIFIILAIYYLGISMYNLIYISIFTNILLAILGIYIYRKFIFKKINIRDSFKEYINVVTLGVPSLLAYLVSKLSSGLDRIFIEFNESVDNYAYYAFAFSMLTVVVGIITSVSSAILPMISRAGDKTRDKAYLFLSKFINLFAAVTALGIVFIPIFIKFAMPKYIESIAIFIVIYPIIAFNVQYSMKHRQYYLLLKKQNLNLYMNLLVLIIVFILNVIVFMLKLDYIYYAYATVLSYYIWYFIMELTFNKISGYKYIKELFFITIVMLLILILSTDYNNLLYNILFILGIILSLILFKLKFILILIKSTISRDFSNVLEDL